MSEGKYGIDDLTDEVVCWANEQFPDRTVEGIIGKLREELKELHDNPTDPMEMADVFTLMLDLCDKLDYDLVEYSLKKVEINRNREWCYVDGVMRHVEEAGENSGPDAGADGQAVDDSTDSKGTIPS